MINLIVKIKNESLSNDRKKERKKERKKCILSCLIIYRNTKKK